MRKRVPRRAAEAEAFAKAFYQRMGEDELPQHSADGWAALAADFLEFARTRKPGTAHVRLFNARPEDRMAGNRPTPCCRSSMTTCRSWSIR